MKATFIGRTRIIEAIENKDWERAKLIAQIEKLRAILQKDAWTKEDQIFMKFHGINISRKEK